MRIGIDTQTIIAQKTGFGSYVQNLISVLREIDSKNEYVFLNPNKKGDLSTPARIWWDQVAFPFRLLSKKVDIVHKPAFSAPIFYPFKTVVTAPDLIGKLYPENFSTTSKFYWVQLLPFSLKKANKIVAISKNTKQDIIKLLNIPEEKIKVIYLGKHSQFKPIENLHFLDKVRQKYSQGKPFILYVSTLEPRKNHLNLLKVFNIIVKEHKIKHNLVLTGKRGWYYKELFEFVEKNNLQDRVLFVGYIPDSDLPSLYNAADLFVFPSLYEGFGLPILESMSCGLPVISSNASSMPEIVEGAGILLDPKDTKAWADAIYKVLTNKNLQKEMGEKSLQQAKKFTWEKCAQETLGVYEEVYQKNK